MPARGKCHKPVRERPPFRSGTVGKRKTVGRLATVEGLWFWPMGCITEMTGYPGAFRQKQAVCPGKGRKMWQGAAWRKR